MSNQFKMDDEDVQVPLGVGSESGEPQEILFSPEKKPRHGATLGLIGIFALGIAAIYFLGMQHQPRGAEASTSTLGTAIDKLAEKDIGTMIKDIRVVITTISVAPNTGIRMIDNPFQNEPPARGTTIEGPRIDITKIQEAKEFSKLTLNTVVLGKTSIAMIRSTDLTNQSAVMIGNKIGIFKVVAIQADSVTLQGPSTDQYKLGILRKDLPPMAPPS